MVTRGFHLDLLDNARDLDDLAVGEALISLFKAGKDRAQKYLMGQIMKASKGQANPKLVTELLTELLNQM